MTSTDMLNAIKDVRQPNLPPHQRLGVMLTVLEELVKRDEARETAVRSLQSEARMENQRDGRGIYGGKA